MKNAAGTEGYAQGKQKEAEPLFPSEGQFSQVVPLSQRGRAAAHARDMEEQEETLVPSRVRRAQRLAHTPHTKKGAEQSWTLIAVAVVLSTLAGAAAGAYMLRLQRPAEAYRPATTAEETAVKVERPEPAAEPPVPQAPLPAPPTDKDVLAAAPVSSAKPVAPAASSDTKAEKAHTPTHLREAPTQPAESPAPRAARPEPRHESPARTTEAREASPAPRPTRAVAASRRPEKRAAAVTPPERPALVSSPPASAKPKKVIQWP